MVIITTNTLDCFRCQAEVQLPAALEADRKVLCRPCVDLAFNRPTTFQEEQERREALVEALGTPEPNTRIIGVDSCPSFSYRNYIDDWNKALVWARKLGKTENLMNDSYSKDGCMLRSGAWAL